MYKKVTSLMLVCSVSAFGLHAGEVSDFNGAVTQFEQRVYSETGSYPAGSELAVIRAKIAQQMMNDNGWSMTEAKTYLDLDYDDTQMLTLNLMMEARIGGGGHLGDPTEEEPPQ